MTGAPPRGTNHSDRSAERTALPIVRLRPPDMSSELTVSRQAFEAVMKRGARAFMTGIDLDPHFVDGQFAGFELVRFHEGDPEFARVDLKPGDVIVQVNDRPIGRPEQFMRVWNEARSADRIVISFLRRGQRRNLTIRVRER